MTYIRKRCEMTREELEEHELDTLDKAADAADEIASTSTNKKLRVLLFSAEKQLRAAALMIAQSSIDRHREKDSQADAGEAG